MPRPVKGEAKGHFVSRYAFKSAEAKKKFPNVKQREAIAYSLYGKKGPKK